MLKEEWKITQTTKKSANPSLFQQSISHDCPRCKEKLMIRSGKSGAFWGCSTYPDCNFQAPLRKSMEDPILAVLDGQLCPACNATRVLKQGRYGIFIGCSQYPHCSHTDILKHTDETNLTCPECTTGCLVQRRSRLGKKFYSCNRYPDCRFTVNFTPTSGVCHFCDFPLLMTKNTVRGKILFCANKTCGKANEKSSSHE